VIKLPIAALVVVVALLGGFYGGYKIGGGGTASAAASSGSNTTNRTGAGGFGGGAGRFTAACPSPGASPAPSASGAAARRATTGTVTNLTNNSFTVHDARCNIDEKVTFDSSVIIRKLDLGQTSDLQENQNVTVTGTRQADGSTKANSITIGAAGGAGFGGFGGSGGANAG
jgi:hypothetical protein